MCAAVDKENLQDSGPHLQRRSFPVKKSAFPEVSKQIPLSHLALARRPLRDTRNLPQSSINSTVGVGIKKCSQECATLEGGVPWGQESTVVNVPQGICTADQAAQPRGQLSSCQNSLRDVDQLNLSAEKNEKCTRLADNKVTGSCVFTTEQDEEAVPEMAGEKMSQYSRPSALEGPNQSWWRHNGRFFPSVQDGLGEDIGGYNQSSECHTARRGSAHSSLRTQPSGSKHRKCLTPISEVSFFKEELPAQLGEGGGSGEKILADYQHFFEQECAVVIDNIRRTSCQGVQGGFSSVITIDTLDVTDIREELLPELKSNLESSILQSEQNVSKLDGNFLTLCLDIKGRTDEPIKEEQGNQQSSKRLNVTFSPNENLSVLLGKIPLNHDMDSFGASLDGTYNLCDNKESGAECVQNLTAVQFPDNLDSKDASTQSNTNGTYVLPGDIPGAGPNVTVDLTGLTTGTFEKQAGVKRSACSSNDTYELQPVVEKNSVEVKQDEGGDGEKVSFDSSENEALADSLCNNSIDDVKGVVASMLNLDDTLDIKNNLMVTSTPMPLPSVVCHIEEPEITSDVCKQLSMTDCVDVCLKGDALKSEDNGHPPSADVRVPLKNFPRPAALARRQDTRSRLSDSMHQKSAVPSSSVLTNARTLLPLVRPSIGRRLSLPALARTVTAPHISSGVAPSAKQSAPSTFGKKSERGSQSPSKSLKSASCVQAAIVPVRSGQGDTTYETKLPVCGLRKPRACGIAVHQTHASKTSLRPQGPVKPTDEVSQSTAPPAVVKQPRCNLDDTLPDTKRKRVDVPSGSTEVPGIHARTARSTQVLRRPTLSLKVLEAKPKKSDTTCTTNGGLPKQVKGMQGLKRPTARLRAPKSNMKASATSATASVQPFSSKKESEDNKYCASCVRYQEEIEKLRLALQELTGVGTKANRNGCESEEH